MSDMTQDRTHDVTIRCRHGEGTNVFDTVREQPATTSQTTQASSDRRARRRSGWSPTTCSSSSAS